MIDQILPVTSVTGRKNAEPSGTNIDLGKLEIA
jgi:hypothetical protein